ncbi:MAG TPA: pyridoxamine 5'-phosphate oxidase family protein [Chloroflexota bacterium]|nr:pyridoxamine 5'-phosphate oxidase family protein [Chloroflexota bacterium]
MASWSDVVVASPQLAEAVRARFDAHGLGLLATVRRDGSPRISGLEPLFTDELWFGMMSRSLKALDLLREPRFALHSATADKQVTDGDAKLGGRAVPVEGAEAAATFLREFEAATGSAPPPGPFHLFRADVSEMSLLRPAGDHLNIDIWREGTGTRRIERF